MYKLGNNILHLDNKLIYGSGVPILTETTLFHMTFENTLTPVVNNTVDNITFSQNGLIVGYDTQYKCEGTYSYRARKVLWGIGDYWQWLVNTTGFKDLTFSFGSLVTSTAFNNKFDVRVSPDGTNWTKVIPSLIYTAINTCYYNLSDVFPASCNNNATTYIRIYMYQGNVWGVHYYYIDDVKLIGFK